MRKHLRARLLVGAGLVVLLVGLSVVPPGFAGYTVHATLTLWYPAESGEAAELPMLARAFEQSHPGLHVRTVAVPAATLEARLAAARATRNGPDVLITDDLNVVTDGAAGLLSDLRSRDSPGTLSDFLPAALAYDRYQGHVYGLPLTTNLVVLYDNRQVLASLGVEYPPAEWDDFIADLRKTSYEHRFGWAFDGSAYLAQAFIYSYGGGLLDTSVDPPQPQLENVRSLYGLVELANDLKYAAPITFGDGGASAVAYFSAGKSAMLLAGSDAWSAVSRSQAFAGGSNLGVAAVPFSALAGDIPRSPAGGDAVAVMAATTHPDQAYALAAYLTSAGSMAVLARQCQLIPARQSALSLPAVASLPAIAPFVPLLTTETPLPVWPGANRLFTPASGFDANVQHFLQGSEDAQTAASNIDASFKQVLGLAR